MMASQSVNPIDLTQRLEHDQSHKRSRVSSQLVAMTLSTVLPKTQQSGIILGACKAQGKERWLQIPGARSG